MRPVFSSKIIAPNRGSLGLGERTPEVLTNLSWEVRFLWGTDDGDSRVCSIRFNPLFRLRPVFISKIIAPNREPLVFGTNSGSADEPLMGGSFFVGDGEGIEALAKPIFVRGVSPFYGSGPAAPFNGSGTAAPFNGRGAVALFNGSGAVPSSMEVALPPSLMEVVLPPSQWNRHCRLARLAPICVLMSCVMVCWRIRIYSKLYLPAWRPPVRREKL